MTYENDTYKSDTAKDTNRLHRILGILETDGAIAGGAAILTLHIGKHNITCNRQIDR